MIQTQTNDSSRIPIVHLLSPISVPLQSMLHSALLAFAAELDRGDAGGAVFCLDVQDHCAILDLSSVRRRQLAARLERLWRRGLRPVAAAAETPAAAETAAETPAAAETAAAASGGVRCGQKQTRCQRRRRRRWWWPLAALLLLLHVLASDYNSNP